MKTINEYTLLEELKQEIIDELSKEFNEDARWCILVRNWNNLTRHRRTLNSRFRKEIAMNE